MSRTVYSTALLNIGLFCDFTSDIIYGLYFITVFKIYIRFLLSRKEG